MSNCTISIVAGKYIACNALQAIVLPGILWYGCRGLRCGTTPGIEAFWHELTGMKHMHLDIDNN